MRATHLQQRDEARFAAAQKFVLAAIAVAVSMLRLSAHAAVLSTSASPATLPAAAAASSPIDATPSHAAILEAWGRIIARESNATDFGLTSAEQAAFARGLELGAQKLPAPEKLDAIYNDVSQFVETHRASLREAQRQKNLAVAPAYFSQLAKQPGITVRPSGLAYEILISTDGPKPDADQTVVIAYRAHLIDGTEFDSTEQMGPVDAVLRTVIPGWREGLQLIGIGGKIRLYVPPALAFTDEDALRLGIPPASIVTAEIELKAIKPSPPEEPIRVSAPVPPPPPLAGFASTQILETWGWITASERGVTQAELSESDRVLVVRGLTAALAGQPAPFDEKAIYPHVDRYVAERQQAFQLATKKQRLAESDTFFTKLADAPAVIRLPSGLRYEIVRAGHGDFPKADQRVRVNYTGRLLDGTIFDRTDPELGPLEIDVGKVIRGWTEGIQKINPGGIIRLYLPPDLAYGDNATGGIPANSALIFEVELLEIHDVPAEEAAPAPKS